MQTKLLPNYYKKIGAGLALLAIISYIIFLTYLENYSFSGNIETVKWIIKDIGLIALILIAFSKEKIENHEVLFLRCDKLMGALLFGVVILVFDSILDMIFNNGNIDIRTGYKTMVMILVFYLFTFNFGNYDHQKSPQKTE